MSLDYDPDKAEYDASFKTEFPPHDLKTMPREELMKLVVHFAHEVIELGGCSYAEFDDECDNCAQAGEKAEDACLYCQAQRVVGR